MLLTAYIAVRSHAIILLQELLKVIAAVQDGNVDECGVCGGLGNSCSISMEVVASIPTVVDEEAVSHTLIHWLFTWHDMLHIAKCLVQAFHYIACVMCTNSRDA